MTTTANSVTTGAETASDRIVGIKDRIRAEIEMMRDRFTGFSHLLYENPELGYQEIKASAWLAEELRKVAGARITHGLGDFPTAVRAEIGTGELVVTLCAEYDALPGMGHACGHNIIAASALAAFTGLAPVAAELGITVRLLGTPAEESGGGKIDLLRQGDFDGTHAAMMVHPTNGEDEVAMQPLACVSYTARFTGRSAHASAAPWEGINALDAMTVALTAIGLARQQLEPGHQIHGILTAAGTAANAIPETAAGEWMIRAHDIESLKRASAVFRRCLDAGAVATGASLEVTRMGNPFSEMDSDEAMNQLFLKNAVALGRDMKPASGRRGGSTDMANVSHYFPTIHPMLGLGDGSPQMHSPDFADFAAGPKADRALIDAALAMAYTAADLAADEVQRRRLLARIPLPTSGAGSELDN